MTHTAKIRQTVRRAALWAITPNPKASGFIAAIVSTHAALTSRPAAATFFALLALACLVAWAFTTDEISQ